jgi:ADP-heptose:LPS heptosyltransferase
MTAATEHGGVLVIKLGALGDFVQALGPMRAIRDYHSAQRVILLTTPPYVELARATGWFDDVWVDRRLAPLNLPGWFALRRRMSETGFDRVYDLQTSRRSSLYFHVLFAHKPEWSGVAKGCSHPHDNPRRDFIHTLDRQAEQLRAAGIDAVPPPSIDWAEADVSGFGLDDRYGILVPGGAQHRPGKRWPAERFGALADRMLKGGVQPVIVGAGTEAPLAEKILAVCPKSRSLVGQTSLLELVMVIKKAAVAVGNDTGPMHLAAVAGCRSLVLFSGDSNPDLCAPRGPQVSLLRRDNLIDLSVEDVALALDL